MLRTLLALGLAALVVACGQSSNSKVSSVNAPKIGIVVPIAHQAMDDMVAGFTAEIQARYGSGVTINVRNAHGDDTVQQAIIKTFERQGYDVIVPIGTDVTLMAVNMVSDRRPVVGLDVYGEAMPDRSNLSGVMEATVQPTLDFLVEACPSVRKIAVVYSAGDKPYQQARDAMDYAQLVGLETQGLFIQQLSDLYPLARRIDTDVDLIVVLKDHVVASGMATLAKIAEGRGIPIYASDVGSVVEGATFALGNRETEIGEYGARKAIAILDGASPSTVGIEAIGEKRVFVNPTATFDRFAVEQLYLPARTHNYPCESVTQGTAS